MINGLAALSSATKTLGAGPTAGVGAATAPTGVSFGDMLGQAASSAMGAIQGGEAAAIQGIQGGVSPFKVVEAVMNAQRTLQGALAIRDKAVAAFQEVSRMAI